MDWASIIVAVVGGGGATGLTVKLYTLLQEHKRGELDREDTAIERWQTLANEADEDARAIKADHDWYRAQYILARDHLPHEVRGRFPPGPPPA